MNSNDLRASFLGFFNGKQHKMVTSAPIVVKNDPTLMFTNAGMNQFKDIFLGNLEIVYPRVANSQKCLRVSGKHNDLEEVGHDTYHHTMFEMLGNWSFGDYFKKEAISWAWEYLTDVLKIDKERLYVTIFEGDKNEGLEMDSEAYGYWKGFIDEKRILKGSKKDNFWEMGESGPCGPCSEIHFDLRDDEERKKTDGKDLVNLGHPLVIEIWNLVFIQFNRMADGSLEKLPKSHVDTGMGFERLCVVVQGKKSNYDTDIFQGIINEIGKHTGHKYGASESTDVAMRVIADHLRAVSFSIADGQLPSNNKAGYVIRRILRRAIRYAYSYLGQESPFIYSLVPVLAQIMGEAYPELVHQRDLIQKVIREEESTFLKTLSNGIKMLDQTIKIAKNEGIKIVSGETAFVLYDTYGFPVDLTSLILKEQGLELDYEKFNEELEKQKDRSKADAKVETSDWVDVFASEGQEFVGYHNLESEVKIVKYRKVLKKGKQEFHLILDKTPFYAESGGQVGDTGLIEAGGRKIKILNTIRENKLNIHIANELPSDPSLTFIARVDLEKREKTECNHSATHLLHLALREVLGNHVEQRGSMVHPDYLRFDFSHFQKMGDDEIRRVEALVNQQIRSNILLDVKLGIPFEDSRKMGAMALFGEKYDETVRVVTFGSSVELCGGTHVGATGKIGYFKILKESAIAAGIRRIEAITAETAENYIEQQLSKLKEVDMLLHSPVNIKESLEKLFDENTKLKKQLEEFGKVQLQEIKGKLIGLKESAGSADVIASVVDVNNSNDLKEIAYQLRGQFTDLVAILGAVIGNKANLAIMLSDSMVASKGMDAVKLIKACSAEIQGGGGGQPFFATAGGKNPEGLQRAVQKAKEIALSMLQ